jgi:hypothetical protein
MTEQDLQRIEESSVIGSADVDALVAEVRRLQVMEQQLARIFEPLPLPGDYNLMDFTHFQNAQVERERVYNEAIRELGKKLDAVLMEKSDDARIQRLQQQLDEQRKSSAWVIEMLKEFDSLRIEHLEAALNRSHKKFAELAELRRAGSAG